MGYCQRTKHKSEIRLNATMASRWRYRDNEGVLQLTFTDWRAYRPSAES